MLCAHELLICSIVEEVQQVPGFFEVGFLHLRNQDGDKERKGKLNKELLSTAQVLTSSITPTRIYGLIARQKPFQNQIKFYGLALILSEMYFLNILQHKSWDYVNKRFLSETNPFITI